MSLTKKIKGLYGTACASAKKPFLYTALAAPLLASCPPPEEYLSSGREKAEQYTGNIHGKIIYAKNGINLITSDLSERLIAENLGHSYRGAEPKFSPDGIIIAYPSVHPSGSFTDRKYTFMDYTGAEFFTTQEFSSPADGDWLPSGSTFAFSAYLDGIYSYTMFSQEEQQILDSNNGTFDHSLAYSPNGNRIAFVHHEYGNNATIKVMNANGTNLKTLLNTSTTHDENLDIEWLNDSQFLFKKEEQGVYRVDISDINSPDIKKVISGNVDRMELSPNKQKLAIIVDSFFGATDVNIYNTPSWEFNTEIDYHEMKESLPLDVAWSPHNKNLAIITIGDLYLFSLPSDKLFILKDLQEDYDFERSVDWGK